MKHLILDTNIYVAFKRSDPVVVDILQKAENIAINTVVLGELLAGFKGGKRETENRRELDQFLDTPRVSVLPVDEISADFFALVFNSLKLAGRPIPTNDIWIAASALQHGRTLATFDGHFLYITGLSLHPALQRTQL